MQKGDFCQTLQSDITEDNHYRWSNGPTQSKLVKDPMYRIWLDC